MVLTRGGSSSFIPTANANSGANNNTNEAPIPEVNVDLNPQGMPPPPPPPQFSLAQMMAMQTQILQGMAATMANLAQPAQAPVQQQPVNPHRDRLGDFLRTKPPTFGSAKNPLEADDWLKTVNKKLMIAQCTDHEKVLFATHQLSGAANDWWEAYYAAHEDADNISWAEFRGAFRAHFIPQGTMKLKKKEFLDLKQGSMTVSEYLNKFTELSRYAPEAVETDASKQEHFMEGLEDNLQCQLLSSEFSSFQRLVDKALIVESKHHQIGEKRKMASQNQHGGSNMRPRIMQQPAPQYRPPVQGRP